MSELTPQQTVEEALRLSAADGCIVIAEERSHADLRWAGNSLTTNGATRSRELTVIATVDGAEGVAVGTVSRGGAVAGDIETVVRAAEEVARASTPAEDAQPLADPSTVGSGGPWDAPPAETSPAVFASFTPVLGETLRKADTEGRLLFGFAEHETTTTYLGTSTGVRLRHDQPTGRLELNAKSADYARSAWAGAHTRDFTDVDVAAHDAELRTRLGWAGRTVELPAGRYETLLPPSAVTDLMVDAYRAASARDAHDGRTVYSGADGGTRIGERLSELPLTMRSDPAEPGLECSPFVVAHTSDAHQSVFDNGRPTGAVRWIDAGTLAALVQTRHSARLTGQQPTHGVDNLVVEGADAAAPDLDAMVAGTSRGLLLTCLWYIRSVDPRTLLVTGLTRDGVYLVENGEVTGAVNNFRFNETPVGMLARVTEIGRAEPTLARERDFFARAKAAPLRVADFNMSTVSDAS